MRLAFKETSDGFANEIFVNDTYIGSVIKDIWSGKWTINPDFNYYASKGSIKKTKYESAYKAGKAMAEMYNNVFNFFRENEDDTQEIDMRGFFKKRKP